MKVNPVHFNSTNTSNILTKAWNDVYTVRSLLFLLIFLIMNSDVLKDSVVSGFLGANRLHCKTLSRYTARLQAPRFWTERRLTMWELLGNSPDGRWYLQVLASHSHSSIRYKAARQLFQSAPWQHQYLPTLFLTIYMKGSKWFYLWHKSIASNFISGMESMADFSSCDIPASNRLSDMYVLYLICRSCNEAHLYSMSAFCTISV